MGRINTFQASGEAEQADPSDETVVNGAPYHATKQPEAARKTAQLLSTARTRKLRKR